MNAFVESFPEWDFDEGARLACSAATFQGPSSAEEIIEVCQWLTDRFSLTRGNFTSFGWDQPPKHPEVVKWLLSEATEDSDELQAIWTDCSSLSNVELSKWFVEEKGLRLTVEDFRRAFCSETYNLGFVEWLYKQVSPSSADLLSSLHTALARKNEANSKWLEQTYIKTTHSTPKLSLVKMADSCHYSSEDWIDWVLAHSSTGSIDCSEPELVKLVNFHCRQQSTTTRF
ncbi:hypothetical protein Pelo_19485 [Pelomyxa schiedti]|nr:hypothetical protein Pelo_19485 [Pelomyxa schiedti]